MSNSYWNRVVDTRLNRRRALLATMGGAAGAAFLAACGGGDSGGSESSGETTGSSLLTKIEDTTKSAKVGGAMKWVQGNEPLHFDGQAQGQVQLNLYNGMVYESLIRNKPGIGEPTTWTEVLPNLATSWEFSPDKTSIAFKLRSGVKWQNIAPVSGRTFDSSDVVESFARYARVSGNAPANVNAVNPNAPIMSVTAPDASTVVYKLKEPTSFIMQRLANMITGEVGSVYPKEVDKGMDPRKQQIGTGAYIQDKYTPSASITYRRNPDYWNKEAGFLDSIEIPFVSQYASWLAQLKTGAIYVPPGGNANILPEDVVPTKKDVPALNMYSFVAPNNNFTPGFTQRFGWQNMNGKKAPWTDVRVRQAMSMAMDRDAYIDTFSNVSAFEKQGVPVDTYYYTSMGYIPGVTLDPRDAKTFGENAKYFKYDIAEGKKLLSAAGFPNGFEYTNHWPNTPAFGAAFPRQMAVIESFQTELGLKVTSDPIDYNLKYLPEYVTKRGQHEGVLVALGAVTSPDPVDYYVWRYFSKSGATSGAIFGDVGSGEGAGDPKVDDFIEKAKGELDAKKSAAILADLQKYLAGMAYTVGSPGTATEFDLAWPVLKNHRVMQQDSRSITSFYYNWWLDETQAPVKRS